LDDITAGSAVATTGNHKQREHSPWGASSAARYLKCAASVYMLETSPALPESAAAAEGTWAHELLEKALLCGKMPPETEGEDPEMRSYVAEVAEWVWQALRENPGAILYIEKPFKITERVWGTNDVAIYCPEAETLYVVDFKYGKKFVSVRRNPQLRIYALGIIELLRREGKRVRRLHLVIAQPRVDHEDGTIREFEDDLVDIFDFSLALEEAVRDTLRAAAATIEVESWPIELQEQYWQSGLWKRWFSPSPDTCRYCVKHTCRAVQERALEAFGDVSYVEDLPVWEPPDPATLDIDRLEAIDEAKEMVEAWLKACSARLKALALMGVPLKRRKLVQTSARRAFLKDQKRVLKGLDEITEGWLNKPVFVEPKLKGIGDVEKAILGGGDVNLSRFGATRKEQTKKLKELLAELMEKRAGKSYSLVPLSDPKEAVKTDLLDGFDLDGIEDLIDEEGDE
jgi:hypothetical protein